MWCFALACALANTSFNFAEAWAFCLSIVSRMLIVARSSLHYLQRFSAWRQCGIWNTESSIVTNRSKNHFFSNIKIFFKKNGFLRIILQKVQQTRNPALRQTDVICSACFQFLVSFSQF